MLFGRYLNKYYVKHLFLLIFGILCLVTVDLVQLQLPFYLGEAVKLFEKAGLTGYTSEIQSSILTLFIKILAVAAIMFGGRVLFRYTIFFSSTNTQANLRHDMFKKAEALSVTYYQINPVGNIMSWFTNDLDEIEEFLAWGTVMLVDATVMTVSGVICLFVTCWQLAIISCVPILLIVVWGLLVESQMSKQWGLRQKAYDKLYDYSQESFTGTRVIKAFVKETQEILSFGKIARKNQEVNIKFVRTQTIFDIIINLIINTITTLIIVLGGWFAFEIVVNGNSAYLFNAPVEMDTAKLVTYIGYFDTLIWPMMALGQVVAMRSRAKTSLQRVSAFLDAPVEIHNSPNAVKLDRAAGNIEFNNFTFQYPSSNKPSLKNINISIKAGERIGIVGKIGCGKTTLVNSLLRIYNLEKDAIKIDGVDLMDIDIHSLRENIAYVPQDNFLYSDTIRNNIAFSNIDTEEEDVIKASKFSDVYDDIMNFTEQFDTVSGERGVTLSGGQKQRISIARAFVKNAPILILDDSVSAVDVKTEKTILANIEKEREGMTTIIIASRASTVRDLDKILVLRDGEVEAFGSHETLLKTSFTYQTMVLLQELELEKGGN